MTSINTGYNSVTGKNAIAIIYFKFLKLPEIRLYFCFAFSKCAWQFNTMSLVSCPSMTHDKHPQEKILSFQNGLLLETIQNKLSNIGITLEYFIIS